MDVLISGAGISGLAAAIALRRSGHRVTVYERSALNDEVGAAVHVPPNASRVLLPWGLDPARARFVRATGVCFYSAATLDKVHEVDETKICAAAGAGLYYAHRVDLHEALKRLAVGTGGAGQPVRICTNAEVKGYDPEKATFTLCDGRVVAGDLIVAADGVHSGAAEVVLGRPNPPKPAGTFNCCYRFLIPTSQVASDPKTKHFLDGDNVETLCRVWADNDARCRLVSYYCRDFEVLNFVALCYNASMSSRKEDWHASVGKTEVLDRFQTLHPTLLAVIDKATDIKRWPLLFRAPIPAFYKSHMALVGDAAHPMLPNHAQGAAQGIEDGVALGLAMYGATGRSQVGRRLEVFDRIRRHRASSVQLLSSAGLDQGAHPDVEQFMEGHPVPVTPQDMKEWALLHDVVGRSVEDMRQLDPTYSLPPDFLLADTAEGGLEGHTCGRRR